MKKIISLILTLTFCVIAFSSCAEPGMDGQNGLSAYELAVQNGFEGSESEWLASLKGKDGKAGEGPTIENGYWIVDGVGTGVKATRGEEKNVEITKEAPLAGKTIVNFGDSITGQGSGQGTDIATYLSQITGATVYNIGYGGCRMTTYMPHEQWDAFSMYRLAEAVASGDYSYQLAAFSFDDGYSKHAYYFRDHYEKLISIDFNEVDIITIAYGTNDLTAGRLAPNDDYTKDFKKALSYSIELIQKAYPHINIYLCTPIYRAWTDANNGHAFVEDSNTKIYYNTYKLTDYVQAIKDVGAEYNLPVIDLYYGLGINKQNRLHYFNINDGTHPNEKGRYHMAKYMAEHMF